MLLSTEEKEKIVAIAIHAELIMYGEEFLNIVNNPNEGKMKITWLSLEEGGSINAQGVKIYSNEIFEQVIDDLFKIELPKHEVEEMNLSWDIQFLDQKGTVVRGLEFGNWEIDILSNMLGAMQKCVMDNSPFQGLIRIIDA